jgi:uncharacterized protein YidB (DUF937 family)
MGLLDSLKSLEASGEDAGQNVDHSDVSKAFLQEADQHPGGLSALLDQFKANGLDQHVNSWIGQGQNQSITPDQVQQGAGADMISRVAERIGVSPGIAKVALAAALPLLISHMSQGGQQTIPSQGGIGSILSNLFTR